jgi:hypothetical protein
VPSRAESITKNQCGANIAVVLRILVVAIGIAVAQGCAAEGDPETTAARMDFARPDFYAAPFPSDDVTAPDGTMGALAFPNPSSNALVGQLTTAVARDRGFATTAGVFVSLSGAVEPTSLPDLAGSVDPSASVYLVALDAPAARVPIQVAFETDGGPFGSPNLLSAVPLAGAPLRARTTYALAVTRRVRDQRGRPLAHMRELSAMPEHALAAYRRALAALAGEDLAGLAVFTTGDPTAQMIAATHHALDALPALSAPPVLREKFDGYCVYDATIAMPDFQSGTPPFAHEGGTWAGGDALVVQRLATSRVVLTVPRQPVPANGIPLAVLIRTGAGGDRPLVDRGVQPATGAPALAPGTGPAQELARVGFAGASVDGPHGGPRNPHGGDEQFLMFNVDNVAAIRDNVRESALELAIFEHVLEGLSFDASDCPGVGTTPVRFDRDRVALIGHSMGATIAPLVLAAEPRFGAAVLSGAGASWMENVLYKEKPLFVRPLVEILLGYNTIERTLRRSDPVLTLAQWVLEPGDPLVYAPLVRGRHVLMEQGIVDHYILPPIANAMSLSLGLDLAGDPLDAASDAPLASMLRWSGRRQIALPAQGNADGATAVVRQHASDGIEDGHEILFQTDAPKAEYRCFLLGWARGKPPPVTPDACPAEGW